MQSNFSEKALQFLEESSMSLQHSWKQSRTTCDDILAEGPNAL